MMIDCNKLRPSRNEKCALSFSKKRGKFSRDQSRWLHNTFVTFLFVRRGEYNERKPKSTQWEIPISSLWKNHFPDVLPLSLLCKCLISGRNISKENGSGEGCAEGTCRDVASWFSFVVFDWTPPKLTGGYAFHVCFWSDKGHIVGVNPCYQLTTLLTDSLKISICRSQLIFPRFWILNPRHLLLDISC